MPESRQQRLQNILLQLLPADGAAIGNASLMSQFLPAAGKAGLKAVVESDFQTTRDMLLESGQAVKGKGRGSATARVTSGYIFGPDLLGDAVATDLLAAACKISSREGHPRQ
jgi:adenine-specific DNA-methyltransferase